MLIAIDYCSLVRCSSVAAAALACHNSKKVSAEAEKTTPIYFQVDYQLRRSSLLNFRYQVPTTRIFPVGLNDATRYQVPCLLLLLVIVMLFLMSSFI